MLIALAMPLAAASAQELEEIVEEQVMPQFTIIGAGGYTYQANTDIDGGGDFSANRFDVAVANQSHLTDDLYWNNTLYFGVDDYDFSGGGFSSGNPWETILALRLGTKLGYHINEQWGIWGGGMLIFSPETGADWGDSVEGGGRVGVDYRHSKTFFISLGVAVLTQIEDDVRVVPSVGMNWTPHDRWAFRVGAIPVSGGAAAAGEIEYEIIEPLHVGLGLLYKQSRFRLDDSGVAPDGVGEESNLPLRVRVGWDIVPQVSLHLVGGVALAGEVQLDDRNGNRLRKQDYDPAPFVGIRALAGF
ncbi:MAG: hypothetical protein ACRERC_04510 [Candidatus Binatia bacterium]